MKETSYGSTFSVANLKNKNIQGVVVPNQVEEEEESEEEGGHSATEGDPDVAQHAAHGAEEDEADGDENTGDINR